MIQKIEGALDVLVQAALYDMSERDLMVSIGVIGALMFLLVGSFLKSLLVGPKPDE